MYTLIETAKTGDEASLRQIVKENSGLVWSVVRRFSSRGYDPEDLYQLGCIGLIKAVRRFDTSYGVKFSTYAVPLITGEIKRFLRDDGMVKVSRRYKEINSAAVNAKSALEAKLMREPTLGEIANHMEIDVYELTEAMEACAPCDSIYRTIGDDDKNETYLVDRLLGDDDCPMADRAALRCAIDSLSDREKTLVAYRYFMDETQSKVAARLGISQVQVSRLEKKILGMLKEKIS